MRVMMIKGDAEPGAAPSEELLTAMGSYNDELHKPSHDGAGAHHEGDRPLQVRPT
jgi:hypothetical protein